MPKLQCGVDLEELRKHWDTLGSEDPLWAILTKPGTEGNRWDLNEFLQTGVQEIAGVMDETNRFCPGLATGSALDFGCGVGRLTQALCAHFERVVGVDISPAMLLRARELNRIGDRCRFVENHRDDLQMFETASLDFVYTSRVLQHMRPDYSKRYLREFARILAPGGVLVFQLTAEPAPVEVIPPTGSDIYRAGLRLLHTPGPLEAGSRPFLTVEVTNQASQQWPVLNLGNHWLYHSGSKRGKVLQLDDARAPVPPRLRPGQSVLISLQVTVPAKPGQYLLEFDLVEEQVCWFKDRGSASITTPVTVVSRNAPQASPDPAPAFEPRMEMYGVPQQEVLDLLREAGLQVAAIQPDLAAGIEWLGYRYYCRKLP